MFLKLDQHRSCYKTCFLLLHVLKLTVRVEVDSWPWLRLKQERERERNVGGSGGLQSHSIYITYVSLKNFPNLFKWGAALVKEGSICWWRVQQLVTGNADQLVSHIQCTSIYIYIHTRLSFIHVWEWATQLFDGVVCKFKRNAIF